MKPLSLILSWLLQVGIVAVMAPAAYAKLTDSPESVALFTELGMESNGRYIIGFLEAVVCVLLLIPHTAVHGAVLTLGIMLGAIMAHLTKIGFTDAFSFLSILLTIASATIIFLRRKQIPAIARMLGE